MQRFWKLLPIYLRWKKSCLKYRQFLVNLIFFSLSNISVIVSAWVLFPRTYGCIISVFMEINPILTGITLNDVKVLSRACEGNTLRKVKI